MRHRIMLTVLWILLSAIAAKAQNDSLIRLLSEAKEDTFRVQLLWEIGASVVFQDPLKSVPYFAQSVRLAQKIGDDKGLEKGYTGIQVAYNFNGQYEKALLYSDSAIMYSLRVNDPNRLALVYLNKADLLFNLDDYKNSLKFSKTALNYALKTGNKDRLGRIYGIISSIYRRQDQYLPAMEYQDKEIAMYREIQDFGMIANGLHTKAVLLLKMKDHKEALRSVREAIVIADSVRDIYSLSSYYATEADILTDSGDYVKARPSALKALEYASLTKHERQKWYITGQMANIDAQTGKYEQAIINGKAALEGFKQLNDLARQQGTALLLAETYEKSGNKSLAFDYMKISAVLADSLHKQAYNEASARLQTEMNVSEKEHSIQLLQKDKELQKQVLRRHQFLLIGSLIILVLLVLGAYLLINRNRMRQQVKELQLRNEIAADLHDEVGSSLSSIHLLSQMIKRMPDSEQRTGFSETMNRNIKETVEKMRDIVWAVKADNDEQDGLPQRMERFAYEICSSSDIELELHIESIAGNTLTMDQRKNLYLVFKEAVNNAVKYSETKKIRIEFARCGKELKLKVTDQGKGFDVTNIAKGNGLDNMQNRAKDLNAALDIASSPSEGTMICLSVPVG